MTFREQKHKLDPALIAAAMPEALRIVSAENPNAGRHILGHQAADLAVECAFWAADIQLRLKERERRSYGLWAKIKRVFRK